MEWAAKRKAITDENAARDSRNATLRDDPTIAKKLKGVALKTPSPPDPGLGDAEYTKAVNKPGYNWWVTNANYIIRGGSSKFEALEGLSGAQSVLEQGWLDRGLTTDFYLSRIDDECAKKIRDFRKSFPKDKASLNHLLEYEPTPENRELGSMIAKLNASIPAKRQKATAAASALKVASNRKTPNPDEIDKLQTKANDTKSDLDDTVAQRDKLLDERQKREDEGLISSFNGGMSSGSSKLSIKDWEDKASSVNIDTGVGAAYYALCAGPKSREGTPPTVVSYDATFSYGAGFNVSSAGGWAILRDIALQPDKKYETAERAALAEMWTFFKKCGVCFHAEHVDQTPGSPFPIDAVHIEEGPGDKVRGYAVSNKTLVKTGVHLVWGQNHQETHGAAYELIRHTPVLLQAFIVAGVGDKVPDQQNADAAPTGDTLAIANFKLFCALHAKTLALPQFIKGRALRIMLVHYMHWGPIFRVTTMILWAFSRQLVKAKITLKGGAAAATPVEVKGDKTVAESSDEGSLGDIANIEFTPTFDTDVQFARLLGAYAAKVLPGASRAQMQGYWKDFLDDLSEHDGQAALVATQPSSFLDSVDDLKKKDATITDAVIASDYVTETIGKTVRVLGKKRDIDEIKAFRGDAGSKPLNSLVSLLQANAKPT
jgi:hypothetical protein